MTISPWELAVVTVVSGRHEHLRRQLHAVAVLDPAPLLHVIVGMGDPDIRGVVGACASGRTVVVDLPAAGKLPLSAARNHGVAEAAVTGATAVALLDVDCIPESALVGDYASILTELGPEPGPVLVCGRVRYLPEGLREDDYTPAALERHGVDHPARVVPTNDRPVPGDPCLVWSLNLGMTVEDWNTVGGFDESYKGYGGEDTDFGQRLRRADGGMWWTRGAGAFHQWHPVSRPPVEHVADIVTNANLFHERWGWYPMGGWLQEFERRGLAELGSAGWRLLG